LCYYVRIGTDISVRSMELINLTSDEVKEVFVEERKNIPIVIKNLIVCISIIKKNNETNFIHQLVLGTEQGFVYILDINFSKPINIFKLSYSPVRIRAWGTYDQEFSLHVLTRNDLIYTINKSGNVNKMHNII